MPVKRAALVEAIRLAYSQIDGAMWLRVERYFHIGDTLLAAYPITNSRANNGSTRALAEIAKEVPCSAELIRKCRSTAHAFPLSTRVPSDGDVLVPWSVYEALASFDDRLERLPRLLEQARNHAADTGPTGEKPRVITAWIGSAGPKGAPKSTPGNAEVTMKSALFEVLTRGREDGVGSFPMLESLAESMVEATNGDYETAADWLLESDSLGTEVISAAARREARMKPNRQATQAARAAVDGERLVYRISRDLQELWSLIQSVGAGDPLNLLSGYEEWDAEEHAERLTDEVVAWREAFESIYRWAQGGWHNAWPKDAHPALHRLDVTVEEISALVRQMPTLRKHYGSSVGMVEAKLGTLHVVTRDYAKSAKVIDGDVA